MTDIPRYDFHIHTKYLGCAYETMDIPSIVKECVRLGVKRHLLHRILDAVAHRRDIRLDVGRFVLVRMLVVVASSTQGVGVV